MYDLLVIFFLYLFVLLPRHEDEFIVTLECLRQDLKPI